MSWVLMTRSSRPVALTASVWADSIASPSRISTSDGGTTTPSVLATATGAWRTGAGSPAAAQARLDGARKAEHAGADRTAHRPEQRAEPSMPATNGAAGLRGSSHCRCGRAHRDGIRLSSSAQAHRAATPAGDRSREIDEPVRQGPEQRSGLDAAACDPRGRAELAAAKINAA